ncbi:MAG: hypothetical protein SCJ94_10555 [Bacillota bacterium]|nr:hypothetical protein [Bacillota bacterium]
MTQAVIRGKISSSGTNLSERLEDLLTSDIFGRLRYLKPEEAIIPILNKIQNSKTGQPLEGLNLDLTLKVSYQFWPYINNVEPDLFLIVPLVKGKQLAVLVECKHKSGKSPRAVKEEKKEDKLELARSDQLVREYLIVEDLKKQYYNAILLYITGHSEIPDDELKESASLVGTISSQAKEIFYESTFWIGWADIWRILRDQLQRIDESSSSGMIIEDTVNLLAYHGYRDFQKFPGSRTEILVESANIIYERDTTIQSSNKKELLRSGTEAQGNLINKQTNIKNAFSLVFNVYQEVALLVKDLEKAIAGKGFRRANKATGHKTGNSYDRPEEWLATFNCRYWVEDSPGKLFKKGPNILFLGCTIIYAIHGKAIEPLFTYGVLQGMNNPEAEFYHEWLLFVNQNQGGNYYYWRAEGNKEFFAPPADNKPTSFHCRLDDNSYAWPKKGVVVTLPLTSIRNPNDLKVLADNMKMLWENKDKYLKQRELI